MTIGAKKLLLMSGGLDVDAFALVRRMASRPTPQRMRLINKTVVALKQAGLWPLLDAFYLPAAHTLQAGLLNWKADRFNLVELTSRGFPSRGAFVQDRGYTPGSRYQVGTPDLTPQTEGIGWKLASAHLMAHVGDNVFGEYIGTTDSGNAMPYSYSVISTNATGQRYLCGLNADGINPGQSVSGPGARANFIVSRTSNSASSIIRDGNFYELAGDTRDPGRLSDRPFVLGFQTVGTDARIAAASIGAGLTASQARALFSIVRSYMLEIGAPT